MTNYQNSPTVKIDHMNSPGKHFKIFQEIKSPDPDGFTE
jgi:hypothetical protein